jgi:hypothetical protein
MFNKQRQESDEAARQSDAKEKELRAWFDATIAEMEQNTTRRAQFAEAATDKVTKKAFLDVQALQKKLDAANEQCQSIVRLSWWFHAELLAHDMNVYRLATTLCFLDCW